MIPDILNYAADRLEHDFRPNRLAWDDTVEYEFGRTTIRMSWSKSAALNSPPYVPFIELIAEVGDPLLYIWDDQKQWVMIGDMRPTHLRGGRREGAGRPSLPPDAKRSEVISVRLLPEVAAALENYQKNVPDFSRASTVNEALKLFIALNDIKDRDESLYGEIKEKISR